MRTSKKYRRHKRRISLKSAISIGVLIPGMIFGSMNCGKKDGKINPATIAGLSTLKKEETKVFAYKNQMNTLFSPLQDGVYTLNLTNNSSVTINTKAGFTYSIPDSFNSISFASTNVEFKDLQPKVEIKRYSATNSGTKKYLVIAGTNNSTSLETVLSSAYIKNLTVELQKKGSVELILYTVGKGIEEKAKLFDPMLRAIPGYTGYWDGVVAVSQGNNIEEFLEKSGAIQSYQKIVRLVPPDAGTLPLINQKLFANKDFLFLISPEYTDYRWNPKSEMYEKITQTCEDFKKKTNAVTISLNTLGSNGDLLLSQNSHFNCAPINGRVIYKSAFSHYNMDASPKILELTLAALNNEPIPSEVLDPTDSGALSWLNEIQDESYLRTLNTALGLDGNSIIGELRTASGALISAIKIVDLKDTPDLYLGNYKLGEFALDKNGHVNFMAASIIFSTIPGIPFSFNLQNKTFTSVKGNDTYSIDLNSQNLLINGSVVGKISDVSNMKITSIPLGDIKIGNISVKELTYDPINNGLNGSYTDSIFGQKISVRISFAEDKIYLGGVLFGSFSQFINGQLSNASQQIMQGIPAELKNQIDSITRGWIVNSITIDPGQRILAHTTRDFGNGFFIELILALGKDTKGYYFKTLENSSYIAIPIEANNKLLLHIKKFEIRGNLNQPLSGELEIVGGTRISKKQTYSSMEARLAGVVLLTAATNPISFGAGVISAVNSGSNLQQVAQGFVAGVAWGAMVGGAITGPLAAIPALVALYSEVKVEANLNFETGMKVLLQNGVISIPKSKVVGAGGDISAVWKLFGIEQLPNLTLAASGGLHIFLESENVSKSLLLSGYGSLSGTIKILFADFLSADATINSFSLLINVGVDPKKASQGRISLDAKVRASFFLKLITITEESLNLTLLHISGETYLLPIKRTRWDAFSDATEEGTIKLTISPKKVVSILSSDLRISGRGGTLGYCPSNTVSVRGGNGLFIEEGKAGCRIEIRVNLFGKGDGGWNIATIPTGETRIGGFSIITY